MRQECFLSSGATIQNTGSDSQMMGCTNFVTLTGSWFAYDFLHTNAFIYHDLPIGIKDDGSLGVGVENGFKLSTFAMLRLLTWGKELSNQEKICQSHLCKALGKGQVYCFFLTKLQIFL